MDQNILNIYISLSPFLLAICLVILIIFIGKKIYSKYWNRTARKVFLSKIVYYFINSRKKIFSVMFILIIIYLPFYWLGKGDDIIYNLISILITVTIIDFILVEDNENKNKALTVQAKVALGELKKDISDEIDTMLNSPDVLINEEYLKSYFDDKRNYMEKIVLSKLSEDGILDMKGEQFRINSMYINSPKLLDETMNVANLYNSYLSIAERKEINALQKILSKNILKTDISKMHIDGLFGSDEIKEIFIEELIILLIEIVEIVKED